MFGRANFRDCVTDALKIKGFGEKRTAEVLELFDRKTKSYKRQGMQSPEAEYKAVEDTIGEVTHARLEKLKRFKHNVEVHASTKERIAQGPKVTTSSLVGDRGAGLVGGDGVGMARGIASMIQADPRFSGLNYHTMVDAYRNKWFALFGDALDHLAKGFYGTQRGVKHMDNVLDELWGVNTSDPIAKSFAAAYLRVQKVMVEDFNKAGGSLRRLVDFIMPQKQSAAKMIKAGRERWIADHTNWLDWGKMTWPNGDLIDIADRPRMLEEAFETLKTGGANRIKPNALHGYGHAVGNALEKDRFLIYKDAKSWKGMHEKYGDGNVYDVVTGHISTMARHSAQVKMFGTSPSMWIETAKAIGMREVSKLQSAKEKAGDTSAKTKTMRADFDSAMRRVEDMFTAAMHQNAMDPHSRLGSFNTTTSNLLISAQLAGAVTLAAPGDMMTSTAVKMLNGSGFTFGLRQYLKGMAPGGYGNLERMMQRSGFVFDETVSSTYAAERFSGMNTYAAPVSRRVGDMVLRTSGLNRHTNVARATAKLEQMGLLVEYSGTAFDELPFKRVMQRYGIDEADWNAVRALKPSSPNGGAATFIRPLDILESNIANKDTLYNKFFAFVDQESNYFVPASTIEATVMAKGLTRPDTLAGTILHSFAMYKNFPLTFAMMYGRLALSQPDKLTRTAFLGGLGLGMMFVGATGLQLREVLKGREPMSMDDPRFWLKSFITGGAAGIWGDFLYSGTTEYGRGPVQQAAGPMIGFYSDAVNLTFGTGFLWAEQADAGDPFDAKLAARSVEFARRYTPGASLWWSRLVLEREMWDRLQEMSDPKARQKWRRKERKQRKDFGNSYWWQPGEHLGD